MNDIAVTRLFHELIKTDKSTVIQRGGARSGKSMSTLQYLIHKMTIQKNAQILITRKTFPALRVTAYKVFIDLLKEYGYYRYCRHSLSTSSLIYMPTNAFVAFISVDNPERIMSTEWNYIHMEEATENKYDDYMRLQTRLSAPTKTTNQMLLSFNPISALHWVKTKVVDVDTDLEEIISNYTDNPFLAQTYIDKKLLPLKEIDNNAWKVFGEGKWGSLENIIYKNYDTVNRATLKEGEVAYGLDFGFNVSSALIKIKEVDDEFYIKEEIYQTKLTNNDLIMFIKMSKVGQHLIYCDSSEPQRIEEMRRAGLNARSANKSVKDGLDFCKRKKLHITKTSLNTIKEIGSYAYRKDKDGNVIDDPVKFNDHAMDAIRYGMYSHWGNKRDFNIITGE